MDACAAAGLEVRDYFECAVAGADGNREFVAWVERMNANHTATPGATALLVLALTVLGVVIEWSTLILDQDGLKLAVGFVILIVVLVIRPQGIFGQARAV